MTMAKKLKQPFKRSILWRTMQEPGSEIVTISGAPGDGVRVQGRVHSFHDGEPVLIEYLVLCDERWQTKYADFELRRGLDEPRYVQLLVDPEQGWLRREAHDRTDAPEHAWTVVEELADAKDIDIEFTPLTNTFPIRRLEPRIGYVIEPTVAWVRFPELNVQRMEQRYLRESERRYRYEGESGFVAAVEVDELGFVVRYGEIWERVAER
jgi:hypothetical protein